MRIALIHHSDDLSNDYAAYLAALLDETAIANEYVIKDYDHLVNAKENIKVPDALLHIVIPAASNFSLKYWYHFKLARILKKYSIDKVVCLYGVCTSGSVKQVLVVPDTVLLKPKKGMFLWQQFAASKMGESLKNAASVITYSNAAVKAIGSFANENAGKITMLPFTAPEIFMPMEWHNKLYIKSRYAQNREYFAAILPDNNEPAFTNLLKGFSKFKKWQQSSMKLIILPKEEEFSRTIENKLDTYKYREDVNLVNDADKKDVADIVAAAYALLHPALNDADLWPVIVGLQSNTPAITTDMESIKEYAAASGLFIADNDPEVFGNELNLLYKDEALKNKMSEAAAAESPKYKKQEHAQRLWELLTQKQA